MPDRPRLHRAQHRRRHPLRCSGVRQEPQRLWVGSAWLLFLRPGAVRIGLAANRPKMAGPLSTAAHALPARAYALCRSSNSTTLCAPGSSALRTTA